MKVIFNISKILKIVYLSSPTNVTKQVKLISYYFTTSLDSWVFGLLEKSTIRLGLSLAKIPLIVATTFCLKRPKAVQTVG